MGGTGYIGHHVVKALASAGHDVVCLCRPSAAAEALRGPHVDVRVGDVARQADVEGACVGVDAVISCLASRTGAPADAWAVDHAAHVVLLRAAEAAGVARFVLLSAICVQRPRLAFQKAKLAFEAELQSSTLAWSIVRPTAFFKSLSGQLKRVQSGAPFVCFGDGTQTACRPISERDLATFMVSCLSDPAKRNAILPIGGPGPALTPKDQAALLSTLLGRTVPLRSVPTALLDAIIVVLSGLGVLSARLRDKAELARIGRYYATESMLVYDDIHERYDDALTPSFGTDTLKDCYAHGLNDGLAGQELREHAVF
jgi:divinyl chlorophyllide a 8-vinyl-reductase